MSEKLKEKKIAILATDGFEEVELTSPKKALEDAGAITEIIAPKEGKLRAWASTKWGGEYPVDRQVSNAKADEYDGLLLPGGVLNPDQLRLNQDAVLFTKAFFAAGKPVAAICHGPQLLIETGALIGREMTSYPSIRTDLKNAGARWVDNEVVVDHGLVTSRSPDDLDAFNEKMIEEFKEGTHKHQKTISHVEVE